MFPAKTTPMLTAPKKPSPLLALCHSVLLAATGFCGPVSDAGAQTVGDLAPFALQSGVDPRIRPGDDFFAYANGDWLKTTEIPAGKLRWGARDEIAALTHQRIVKLLADAGTAPAGSSARKAADFHAAYTNQAAIEVKGIAALKPLLEPIARLRDKAGLTRHLGRALRADVDPLNKGIYDSAHVLGLAVQSGIQGDKTNVAFLLQGGLGLPDRAHYLGSEPRQQALRTHYQHYIGQMLGLAGFDNAAQRAQAVMALETAIAQSHATREASAADSNAENLWKRADFARQAPGMDWSAFFAAAGLARQQGFVVWQPSAIKGLGELLVSQPLQAWQDYLRFHAIHQHADVLPQAFSEQAGALRDELAGGPAQAGALNSARAQRALDATQSAMGDAVGKMYVERHFPAEDKARVQAIAANVIAAFSQRVEAVAWMSPSTKQTALAKLKALYFGIGYPQIWQDYSDLMVDPADALGNLQRVARWNHQQAVARLGKPEDQKAWGVAAQWPGAMLLFHRNAYNFSAALLQPPKFEPAGSDATNYGAIGAIIGHEVSHFVDVLGAEYGPDGRMQRWWTAEDMSRYQASTEALVNQFSNYQAFSDLSLNGKRTLTENLADLTGLATAFEAHRRALGAKARDKDHVRQQDREFFIGFARSWRIKSSEKALRTQITTGVHAPERWRIATVRNFDAWYEAFDVQPGQPLYLEPARRLRIW
jgi:putative endopeptidase